MTEEHVKYLETVYPKLYGGRYSGFAIGDGWFSIIDHLSRTIQSHCDWSKTCPPVTIAQVKEKFGSLRFYYDGGDEYIAGAVSMAESMAGVTCESCGVPGTSRGGGWIHVACDACEAERVVKQKQHEENEGIEQ